MAVKEAERPRRRVYLPCRCIHLDREKCCKEVGVVRSGLHILPIFPLVNWLVAFL